MTPIDIAYLAGVIPAMVVTRHFMIRGDVAHAERDYEYEVEDGAFERGFVSLFAGVIWPFALGVVAIGAAIYALGRKWR